MGAEESQAMERNEGMAGNEQKESGLAVSQRLWTAEHVAEFLQVSARKVWRMKSAGQMPDAVVIGGRSTRWDPDAIMGWVRQGCPDVSSFKRGA